MSESKTIVSVQIQEDLLSWVDEQATLLSMPRQRYITLILRAAKESSSGDFTAFLERLITIWNDNPPDEIKQDLRIKLEPIVRRKLISKYRTIVKDAIENAGEDL